MEYRIKKIENDFKIDADWNKQIWEITDSIHLENFMGSKPDHFPNVYVKLLYSEDFIYVIFKVKDKYIKSITEEYQGSVCNDSCVEFFFTPSENVKNGYFNVETNCGGVQLFNFKSYDRKIKTPIEVDDYKDVMIMSSLPRIISSEIEENLTWFVEYKIPLELIKKYSESQKPTSGTVWKSNFYKCADKTSHPHWLTWNIVDHPTPNFHLPQFFGTLIFE